MRSNSKLILDTCALIWLTTGSNELSKKTKEKIDKAEVVLVSMISIWEISLKVAQKKLKFNFEPKIWYEKAIQQHNLIQVPLSLDVLVGANKLPFHHRDPADRFIITTALLEKATIVTKDSKFLLYEDIEVIG